MTTNNYTLSYDKVMLDEFYDEESNVTRHIIPAYKSQINLT